MTQGLSRSGFDIDLRDGLASEGAFGAILAGGGDQVEVKMARRAREYGTVFVELYQTLYPPPRASGLSVTTSTWWVWDLGDGFMVVRTDEMRRLTLLAYEAQGSTWGGDYNKQLGVRVPLRWFCERRPVGEPTISLGTVLAREVPM